MPLTKKQALALFKNAQKKLGKGDYEGCLKDSTVFLSYCQETGNKSLEARAYRYIGYTHEDRGNYREALPYHKKDLDIALQLGDKGGEGTAYSNIGSAHYRLGNY